MKDKMKLDLDEEQKETIVKILVTVVLLAGLHFVNVSWAGWLYLIPYLIIGFESLKEAAEGIIHGEILDENFLMVIATIGAFVLAFMSDGGDYNEAVFVMLFYRTGELFEDVAVDRSRRNISALMDIRPDYVNLVCEGDDILERDNDGGKACGVRTYGIKMCGTEALDGENCGREIYDGKIGDGENDGTERTCDVEINAAAKDDVNRDGIGKYVKVAPNEVPCKSTIVILPGERVPIDGTVMQDIF